MADNLKTLRNKVDEIDTRIHDLLMSRADLVADISKAKQQNKDDMIQPAREARLIRRLLDRHKGPLPEAAIVRIWRELVGAISQMQTGLSCSIYTDEEGLCPAWDMARNFFGSAMPMKKKPGILPVVSAVREDEVAFGVLPWPKEDEVAPWWTFLLHQDRSRPFASITGILPFGCVAEQLQDPHDKAVIVSKFRFMDSGDDNSFVATETDFQISRSALIETLKRHNLEVLSFNSKHVDKADERVFHLIEVKGFIDQNDERLAHIRQELGERLLNIQLLGGYPVQPLYKHSYGGQYSHV